MKEKIDSFKGDYFFLSNFYEARVIYNGIEFPTSEHAYQAAKSNDEKIWRFFSRIETPGEAKRLGRMIDLRPDWEDAKILIMKQILISKFSNRALMERLKATGDTELIEGNSWGDQFWGVCNGKGKNMLGKLLMKIRDM